MIDNKVTFEMVFPTEPYRNFKLGIEGTIEPHETYGEAAMKAFEKVMGAGDKVYAALRLPISSQSSFANSIPPITEVQTEKPIPEDQRTNALIQDIQSCTEIKVLESYRLLAKKDAALQTAYKEMYQKLSNNG